MPGPFLGTDIVSVERVRRLVDGSGDAFLRRWFTEAEIAYCAAKARPSQHFAARLAAKEAVVKSIHLAWDGPIPYGLVEIFVDGTGAPGVRLDGRVLAAAQRAGIDSIDVSMSHCAEYATATAMARPFDLASPRGGRRIPMRRTVARTGRSR